MPALPKERKSKFTASVTKKLIERLDQKAQQLNMNRSESLEAAIGLWLERLTEEDDEAYCAAAGTEMNDDARSWNATTKA